MFDWLSGNTDLWGMRAWLNAGLRGRAAGKHASTTRLVMEPLESRELLDASHLLIGTYNTDISDMNGANRNTTYYQTVLAAVGQEDTYYTPQAPDILTVTEVRSNAVSGSTNDTDWVAQQLNAVYGAGTYSHGTVNGSGGGGTQGIIYNTHTIQLLQETAVGSGLTRQELRYKVRPLVRPDGSADFYIYVGHYKAGSVSADGSARNTEATQVRANADALGANVPILYTGDFNDTGTDEAMSATLMHAGNGQAFDPINRSGHWDYNPAFVDIDTIRSTGLNGRFDELWESGAVLSSRGGNGLQDMPSTYHAFGNNGSVAYNASVASTSNTALHNLSNRTTVLTDLTHASDHIPVFQLYALGGGQMSQATHYSVTAVATAVAGSPFTVTVKALDAGNNVVPTYSGTVTFSTSDPSGGSLPGNYTFTAADNGIHTFTSQTALYTPGSQTLTATDVSSGITGSVTINVTAAAAAGFYITSSADANGTVAGSRFDVTVYAVDPYGNVATGYRGTITFSSGDPAGATLPGNYTFTAADQGGHTFFGATALYTAGSYWDVTATDVNSGITGSDYVYVIAQANSAVAFYVMAPARVAPGMPFDATVYAIGPHGVDTGYGGTVHWGATDGDPGVVLPADYTFQPSDQGVVTFSSGSGDGFTLITPGTQYIFLYDTVSHISGSAAVVVTGNGQQTGKGHAGADQALALAATGQAPAHAVAPMTTKTDDIQKAAIDRFFVLTRNDPGAVPAFRKPDATPGHGRDVPRDASPELPLMNLGENTLTV